MPAPADPTKTGYTFKGWDQTIPTTMPAENVTITALWNANQYTITFDSDGGTSVESITADCDAAITAPANPTKEGYTSAGWERALPATMPAEGLSVKAIWKVNQYSITFDSSGGSAVNPITADFGEAITAPANPTKEGYTFQHWKTVDGKEYTIPTTMPAESVTITAVWSINSYTITFEPNGGSVSGTSRVVTYGEAYGVLPEPTRDGYGFNGWFTESTGGTQVTAETKMGAVDVTVYAQWNKSEFGIAYALDGGNVSGTNPTTYSVESSDFKLIDPVKTGYNFAGWMLSVDGEAKGNVGTAYTVKKGTTGDLSFTATWTPITYTVQFSATDATDGSMENQGFTYDEAAKSLTANAYTRTGYTFAGWKDENGNSYTNEQSVSNLCTTHEGTVVLTAQWTANTYTVQFDANDGTGTMTSQEFTYDEAQNLTANNGAITKEGYRFAGWNTKDDGSGTAYADSQSVSNLTATDGDTVTR